jgi:hypothetical protein
MKKYLQAIALAMSCMLMCSSCATIFTGTRQSIVFDADVPKTRVLIDGVEHGETPVSVRLRKGYRSKTIAFEQEGYERKTIKVPTEFNPVSILNLGVFVGWVVDLATGAIMRYDESYYKANLESADEEEKSGPGSL